MIVFATCILNNTGIINIEAVLDVPGGTVFNCGTITQFAFGNPAPDTPYTAGGPSPMGTPCDDGDAGTENDMIIDGMCTCEGTLIAPIPTMSEWGIMILSLMFLIVGTLAMARRRETILS